MRNDIFGVVREWAFGIGTRVLWPYPACSCCNSIQHVRESVKSEARWEGVEKAVIKESFWSPPSGFIFEFKLASHLPIVVGFNLCLGKRKT